MQVKAQGNHRTWTADVYHALDAVLSRLFAKKMSYKIHKASLSRRLVAECLGTALLLATIVGSGIMGERLAGGNRAIALLASTISTGSVLIALILALDPISRAHFNPAVTLANATQGEIAWRDVPLYIVAQIAGAFAGVATAHLMFVQPVFDASEHNRDGMAQIFSEFIATFGLLIVIWGCSRRRSEATPFAVGAYIAAAHWFTSSTSFANPAVTLARSVSDTSAGIQLNDIPGFIIAQLIGAGAATLLFRWLVPVSPAESDAFVVPHSVSSAQKPERQFLEEK